MWWSSSFGVVKSTVYHWIMMFGCVHVCVCGELDVHPPKYRKCRFVLAGWLAGCWPFLFLLVVYYKRLASVSLQAHTPRPTAGRRVRFHVHAVIVAAVQKGFNLAAGKLPSKANHVLSGVVRVDRVMGTTATHTGIL